MVRNGPSPPGPSTMSWVAAWPGPYRGACSATTHRTSRCRATAGPGALESPPFTKLLTTAVHDPTCATSMRVHGASNGSKLGSARGSDSPGSVISVGDQMFARTGTTWSSESWTSCRLPWSRSSGHGSPLCQDAAGKGVLGCVLDGLRCGFSEELVWGCEPAALESESLPRCPPEPVTFLTTASSSMCR